MKKCVEFVRSIRSPAIMLVAAVALFVIAEVVVRVVAPQDNVMTFVSHDQFAMDDSVIGHVLIPNAYAVNKSPEYNVEYRTNAAGMRDRTLHEIPKPPGLTRILLLGDSFTFCVGTDYEHSWPVIFERRLLADGFTDDACIASLAAGTQRLRTNRFALTQGIMFRADGVAE